MLLIVNCIVNPRERAVFAEQTMPRIWADTGLPWEHRTLEEIGDIEDIAAYSGLFISGSELSASKENPLDDQLYALIQKFVDRQLPILGICYGHQMIARLLGGKATCRRSATPEFGWRFLETQPNPLFAGIEHLICAHSHYDEVCRLSAEFKVIASTPHCAVQAFQWKDQPVWGLQFHPEIGFAQGEAMFADNLANDPSVKDHFENALETAEQLAQNSKIFQNFACYCQE